jgi:oxygen-independent coproporphyrinogen-3 oxidase
MLPTKEIANILGTVSEYFDLAPQAEITLEANPNDLSESYLEGLMQSGVNRLSVGMQSADTGELVMYGRQHDHEMTARVIEQARRIGFENISLDLIFGNPKQTMALWEESLSAALALEPNHVSLYGLEVKGGTVLKKQIDEGLLPTPEEDLAAEMYEMARTRLNHANFLHYEISNWTKPTFEARHNLQYWHHQPYLGVGAGAHGYMDGQRTIVIRSPQKYITAMQNLTSQRTFPRTPATSKITPVTRDMELSETIMVQLRLVQEGIDLGAIQEEFGIDLLREKSAAIQRLLSLGMIEVTDERLRLSEKGHLLSTPIIAELY